MVSVDFFVVPTIRFQIAYVFLVLAHERRRIVHFAVTAHPTAEWTAQQLREAFPWDSAPRYLLPDRDRIFGNEFVEQVRRECLDHLIVFNERSLHRIFRVFLGYYHRAWTHVGLQKDTPELPPVQPPDAGRVVSIPEVGGLHHRYERRAA